MKNKDRIIFKKIKIKNHEDFEYISDIQIFINATKYYEVIMDYGKRGASHYLCNSFSGKRLIEGIGIGFKNLG